MSSSSTTVQRSRDISSSNNNNKSSRSDNKVVNTYTSNTATTPSDNRAKENNNVITPVLNNKTKKQQSKKERAKVIANTKTSLDRRMTVERNVVDELLLVCGVIGSSKGNEVIPVTDSLNWLQDLQRALRRDEDLYRPISLLLGKWKIVEQKLLPLMMTCRYDTPIVLTVLKILVILTKPLSENTIRAGQMIIDTSSPKSDPAIIAQQIKLRSNALEQAEQLMEYKRMVTFHPSHHQKINKNNKKGSDNKNNNNNKGNTTGLLYIFVSLLAEPLSRSGASRTDADHLTIELVLHLIRNLLSSQPLLNSKLLPCVMIYQCIFSL
jgi:timeless